MRALLLKTWFGRTNGNKRAIGSEACSKRCKDESLDGEHTLGAELARKIKLPRYAAPL